MLWHLLQYSNILWFKFILQFIWTMIGLLINSLNIQIFVEMIYNLGETIPQFRKKKYILNLFSLKTYNFKINFFNLRLKINNQLFWFNIKNNQNLNKSACWAAAWQSWLMRSSFIIEIRVQILIQTKNFWFCLHQFWIQLSRALQTHKP